MRAYLNLVRHVLDKGVRRPNRTGVVTLAVPGYMFEHDMADGFPLLTTKHVPFRLVASELEFFIRGYTDKKWLQDRKNHIWDPWARQDKVAYANLDDPDQQAKMRAERDLGPIYGWEWRNFGAEYPEPAEDRTEYGIPKTNGVDQLMNVVQKLRNDPTDRRMIVSAWNPVDNPKMALPPCHYAFQVLVIDGKLNLLWNQRSVDTAIGLPFNIASYAILLHLLAKEAKVEEGKLVGFLADTHIYENHLDGLKEQLSRKPHPLPQVKTENFTTIFGWEHTDSVVEHYHCHPKIPFPIAV